ncbi:DUF3107 domain-containing protein [Ornithinicoccus hortensis]|uniref:Uncharacterized protein DUF3107 n=1 Tax=Ornithinicoccus hortensis TaxID=82346 RepID=A0A542YQ31_9MICO|nr:DUF3107 domain-containing protein [Ornithinicoccus hortensis]TQL50161.1 uncharacterized protein DUF3107 [Ornithinicoccus hortensis]
MEIRIGVREVAREVSLESAQSAEEVEAAVSAAVESGTGVLSLTDEKGGKVIVPVSSVGYVEIGSPEQPRVGFGRG